MAILFSNATILPMTADEGSPKTFTGFVGVAGSRIALVTESASEADAFRAAHPDARIIDCTGRLLMPGLVNTHCHAAMTLQRSYADDIALMEWLHDYIWPFEARQTADDVALGMTLGVVEMLLGGVTSFVAVFLFSGGADAGQYRTLQGDGPVPDTGKLFSGIFMSERVREFVYGKFPVS